jgi:hypothetical protein
VIKTKPCSEHLWIDRFERAVLAATSPSNSVAYSGRVLQNVSALFSSRIRGVRPLVSVNIPLDGGLYFSGLIAAPVSA